FAVPDDRRVVRQSVAAVPVRLAGILADDVLLRSEPELLFGLHLPRFRAGDSNGPRRLGAGDLSAQPLSPGPVLGRLRPVARAVQRSAAGSSRGPVPAAE